MGKKHEAGKQNGNGKGKHVHVESGPNKCLSYQVETTVDVFESVLGHASRRVSEPKPARTNPRRRTSHS